MNVLKKLTLTATLASCLGAYAQTIPGQITARAGHGGGNGGDDLEMELRKKSLQIGYFLKSSTGSQVFKSLNADAVLESIEKTDIDVVALDVVDKYGTIRTCVNEPERALITCNLARINELKKNKQDDILTGMLFHEILGVMGLELGYQDNVSMYPVSSKIIPYHSVVVATPVAEAQIRPEYYGKDSRSYGITLENKKTKETIRMICLNDHVEVHRCRNYSVVRKAGDFQAPLVTKIVSMSPSDLAMVNMDIVTGSYPDRNRRQARDLTISVLNLKNNLALIGQTQSVSEGDYERTLALVTAAVMEKENAPVRAQAAEAQRLANEEAQKKAVEQARIDAAKKEEEEKKNAVYNRKDAENVTQIGKFSMTFLKDFVMLANTDHHVVMNNQQYAWIGNAYQTMVCKFVYPNKDVVDRLIPAGTVLDIDMTKPIRPEPKSGEIMVAAPTMSNGKISLKFECVSNMAIGQNTTIGIWKNFFKAYTLMTLAAPEQIK